MNAMDRFSLAGRRALVTGASRGLGFEFARTLAQAGAQVMLTAAHADGLQAAQRALGEEGLETTICAVDLTEPSAAEALAAAVSDWGGADIVVANAGVEHREPVGGLSQDAEAHTFTINLSAPIALTNALVPAMKAKGWGRLIYLSSVAAHASSAQDGHALYSASKAGLEGFMRTAAMELGPYGITANALAPGVFLTDMAERSLAQDGDAAQQVINAYAGMTAPLRWGRVPELAGPLLLLASDAGSYVTGTVLKVDGGFTVKSRPSGDN